MSGLDSLNADYQDIVLALTEEGAEFLIVGAYAVSFHGYARTTGDIDLLVRPTPANATAVWRALLRFGAPVAALGLTVSDFTKQDVVVQLGVAPRRVDLLTSIAGVSFDAAWEHRDEVDWRGRKVAFLGIEQLLVNKRATGRPKDELDAAELERLRRREG